MAYNVEGDMAFINAAVSGKGYTQEVKENQNEDIKEGSLEALIAGFGKAGNGAAAAAAAGANRTHERETPADDNWQRQNAPVEDSEEDLEDDYDR
jgi:hypothetical protein